VSPRVWQERVRDILQAIEEIQRFIEGMDFETFHDDDRTIRAVEMNLIIIGEAVSRIPEKIQETHSQIPWSLMRSMRNRMAHVYFSVDERLLWETATEELDELVPLLEAILFSP
jgi:uncharacterized protein with HEPN domain